MLSHLSQAVATSLLLLTSLLWILLLATLYSGAISQVVGTLTPTGTTFQLGSTASAKLGISRAAATYNLEVGLYILAHNHCRKRNWGKFIIQKGGLALVCILPTTWELIQMESIPLVISELVRVHHSNWTFWVTLMVDVT